MRSFVHFRRRSREAVESLGLLLLLLVVTLRVIDIDDLGLWDEAFYLQRGINQALGSGVPFADGGSYFDLYWIISLAVDDPVTIYYIVRIFSAFALVLAAWICVRLFTGPRLAWSISALVVLLPVTRSWPGVGNFGASLCLVAVAVAVRFWTAWAFVLSSSLAWIAAASRPEFLLVALMFTSVAVVASVREHFGVNPFPVGRIRSFVLQGLTLVAVPIALIWRHGSPFSGDERSWVAFSQHFALRNANSGEDSWLQSADVAARFFGNVDSLTEAVTANPEAVVVHAVQNFLSIPLYLGASVVPAWWLDPAATPLDSVLIVITLLVVFLALITAFRGRMRQWLDPRIWVRGHGRRILLVVASGLVALAPIVIIYPRTHYFGFLAVGLLSACFVALGRIRGASPQRFMVFGTASIVTLVVAVAGAVGAINSLATSHPLLKSVVSVRGLDLQGQILSADRGISAYLPALQEVGPDDVASGDFDEFVSDTRVAAVLLNDRLLQSSLAGDSEFQIFANDPAAYGFVAPYMGSEIFVRNP